MPNRPTDLPFSQEISQAERAELLRQDRGATRSDYTRVTSPEPTGRWAKPDQINGATPVVDYPRIAGGPWGTGPQVPEEPPLGIDVSYVEPCGEPWEAERAYLLSAAASLSSGDGDAGSSSPAPAADLSPLLGSADPAPTTDTVPASERQVGADPTLGSNPDPSASSFAEDRQLGPLPSHPDSAPERRAVSVDRDRGSGSPFSRPWRRIG
jgi:hypothetical protein